jgi:hypothetical protein
MDKSSHLARGQLNQTFTYLTILPVWWVLSAASPHLYTHVCMGNPVQPPNDTHLASSYQVSVCGLRDLLVMEAHLPCSKFFAIATTIRRRYIHIAQVEFSVWCVTSTNSTHSTVWHAQTEFQDATQFASTLHCSTIPELIQATQGYDSHIT